MAGHDKDHKLCCCGDDHNACEDGECTSGDCTTEQHGLQSKADKIKLDAIGAGAGPPTKEFWAPVVLVTQFFGDNWPVQTLVAGQTVGFSFPVPHDFSSLSEAVIVVLPNSTETIQWDIYTSIAALGEHEDDADESALNEQQAVTSEDITELDISGVLTGIAADDYVGVRFSSDTTHIFTLGLRIKYA